MAIQLQELLEAQRYLVSWNASFALGPTAGEDTPVLSTSPDIVVLSGDALGATLPVLVKEWRALDPAPAIVVVGLTETAHQAAQEARTAFVRGTGDAAALLEVVHRAERLRFASGTSPSLALRVLRRPATGEPIADEVAILRHKHQVPEEVVREVLRHHASHYATATERVTMLREHRALEIPEIELLRWLDGTFTVQTILARADSDKWRTARLLWALASVDALLMTPEPIDPATPARRLLRAARHHLRARRQRLEHATHYDVLELTRAANRRAIVAAGQELALRFAPQRFESLDLAELVPLVEPLWQQIVTARRVLLDPPERGQYNDWLASRGAGSPWTLKLDDAKAAAEAFSRGQQALGEGDVHRALANMAAAARLHPEHPEYEASLAWARFRSQLATGKDRQQLATRERAVAEAAMAGARPWPLGLVALALLCVADGDPAAARWHLAEALTANPGLATAQRLLQRIGS